MANPRANLSADASVLTLGRIASQIGLVLTVSVLSYNLSKHDYALFAGTWLIVATMLPLMTLRLPDSLRYFVPQLGPEGTRGLVGRTFFWLLGAGAVASVAIALAAVPVANLLGNPPLADTLRWFCLFPLVAVPAEAVGPLLITLGRSRAAAAFDAASGMARLAVVVALVLLTGNLFWILGGLVVYAAARTLVLWAYTWRSVGRKGVRNHLPTGPEGCFAQMVPDTFSPAAVSVGKQLKYSLPLVGAVGAGLLVRKLDQFIVMGLFSTEQFAVYRNGAFEIPLAGMLAGSVMAVLIPQFVTCYRQGRLGEMNRLWTAALRKTSLLVFPMAAFFFAFADEIVVVLFSSRYAESAVVFRILALVIPIRVATFNGPLTACGRTHLVTIGSVAALVAELALCLVLVGWLGPAGAAVSVVASVYIVNSLNLWFIHRLFGWPLRALMPWAHLGKVLVVAAVAAAAGWSVGHGLLPGATPAVVRFLIEGALAGLLYAGIVLASGLLSRSECVRLLREMIGRPAGRVETAPAASQATG